MPATAATPTPVPAEGSKPGDPAKSPKDRSPNYPAITFTDALEKVQKIYDAEKTHAMSPELAAKRMGYEYNGRTRMFIAALKHYGLLVGVGTQVRVTEDATKLLIYPKHEPKRVALVRQLAMQPKMFQAVVQKYGMDLPSDENLTAFLQLELGFTADACPTMIRVLRHSIAVAGAVGDVDAKPPPGDTPKEAAPGDALMPPPAPPPQQAQTPLQAPPKVPPMVEDDGFEMRSWNLGEQKVMRVALPKHMTQKNVEKLRKWVEVIAAEVQINQDDAET
jgi:hypothetical protein